MGDSGDGWLQCFYCGKWGKCAWELPPSIPALTDVDGAPSVLMCDDCLTLGEQLALIFQSADELYDRPFRIVAAFLGH